MAGHEAGRKAQAHAPLPGSSSGRRTGRLSQKLQIGSAQHSSAPKPPPFCVPATSASQKQVRIVHSPTFAMTFTEGRCIAATSQLLLPTKTDKSIPSFHQKQNDRPCKQKLVEMHCGVECTGSVTFAMNLLVSEKKLEMSSSASSYTGTHL